MRFKLCQKSRRDISMGYIATYNDYAFNGLRVFQYGIRITENRQRSFAIKVVKITTKHTWKVRSSTFYLRVYRSYCSADFTNQAFKDQPAIRCIQIKEYWCHLNNLGYLDAGYRVKRCDLMKSGGETAYCLGEHIFIFFPCAFCNKIKYYVYFISWISHVEEFSNEIHI